MVHESKAVVEMRDSYIPGFLAFREVDFLLERLSEVHKEHPQHCPQVVHYMCDWIYSGKGVMSEMFNVSSGG